MKRPWNCWPGEITRSRGWFPICFRLADYRRAFQVAFDKRRHHSLKVALDLRN